MLRHRILFLNKGISAVDDGLTKPSVRMKKVFALDFTHTTEPVPTLDLDYCEMQVSKKLQRISIGKTGEISCQNYKHFQHKNTLEKKIFRLEMTQYELFFER